MPVTEGHRVPRLTSVALIVTSTPPPEHGAAAGGMAARRAGPPGVRAAACPELTVPGRPRQRITSSSRREGAAAVDPHPRGGIPSDARGARLGRARFGFGQLQADFINEDLAFPGGPAHSRVRTVLPHRGAGVAEGIREVTSDRKEAGDAGMSPAAVTDPLDRVLSVARNGDPSRQSKKFGYHYKDSNRSPGIYE